jgi:endonuclease III
LTVPVTSVARVAFISLKAKALKQFLAARNVESQIASVKPKRRVVVKPEGGWDNTQYRFKFNFTPFPEHDAPSHEQAAEVFQLLRNDLKTQNVVVGEGERGLEIEGPAHGSADGVTVDAVVRTILSQATSNDNALFVQQLLLRKFPYTVKGEEVTGTIPNYHTMRLCSHQEIEDVIKPGGIYTKRAIFIKAALDKIYEANTVGNPSWDGVETGNAENAADFVPGLLSLDFLKSKGKVDLFNWFLSIPGIGIKTVSCILEFNYRLPVCAVDTHVLFMAAALKWIPSDCLDANRAAMHLDARLPDELKHDIHQAFWNHRQFCIPCRRASGEDDGKEAIKEKDKVKMTAKCVLEHLVRRRKTTHDIRKKKDSTGTEVDGEEKAEDKATEAKPMRKAAKMPFEKMTPEKAAENGYVLQEMSMSDDFAAGSVNISVRKLWVLAA